MFATDQNSQQQGDAEKNDGEIDGEFLQHIGGLRTPDLAGGGIAKGSTQALLPRALHEHDKDEQDADDDFDCGENANEDVHKREKGREYGGSSLLGKEEF